MHLIAIGKKKKKKKKRKKITHRVDKKENFMGILGTLRAIIFILACRNSTRKNFD